MFENWKWRNLLLLFDVPVVTYFGFAKNMPSRKAILSDPMLEAKLKNLMPNRSNLYSSWLP
jgi:hypothetical protein